MVDLVLAEFATKPLAESSAAQVLLRIARLDSRQHLLLPRNLILLLRTLMLLEGLMRALDPGFALPAEPQARSGKVAELLQPGHRAGAASRAPDRPTAAGAARALAA